jgi:hypothetical protein
MKSDLFLSHLLCLEAPKAVDQHRTIDLYWMVFFGLPEQEPHGVIFLRILVNGVLYTGNSEDGRYPGFGMQCLKH